MIACQDCVTGNARNHSQNHRFLTCLTTHLIKCEVNTNSYIYKWEGRQFILFQSISTLGSWVPCMHSFVMCGQMFLGFTEREGEKSTLYRFSLDKFTKYQEISTVGPYDMTAFEYKGYTNLAITNIGDSTQNSTESTLYKWTTGM